MKVPVIGFGAEKLIGAKGVLVIEQALHNEDRFLEIVYAYENEVTLGEAVRESGLNHSEVLISSKHPEAYHQYDLAIPAIQESLYRAGIDYFDLYLIHWLLPEQDKYVEAWQALIDAQKFGLVPSLGGMQLPPRAAETLK